MRRIAITRDVSPAITRCELTHLQRAPIDLEIARSQHRAYEKELERLGWSLLRLPVEPDLPDSVFVEDAAIVLDEVAVITRPGAPSRRPETAAVAEALRPYRLLLTIEEPGTMDGGDVLRIDRDLYIGVSRRTNEAAVEQMKRALARFGYRVTGIEVSECLHLKSAVTLVDQETILINPRWVIPGFFQGVRVIETDPGEPYAANGLLLGRRILYPTAFPRTRERLTGGGIRIVDIDMSELAKAEGAVTCCSILFEG